MPNRTALPACSAANSANTSAEKCGRSARATEAGMRAFTAFSVAASPPFTMAATTCAKAYRWRSRKMSGGTWFCCTATYCWHERS